jgi:isocitrate dehydrogenase kinase/phosphatase
MDEEAHSPAAESAIAQQRAARCFKERDWQQGRSNAVARIELYDQAVNRALGELGSTVEASESGKAFWIAVKERYAELIREYPDNAFFKTFFSSISRRLFNTVGVDPRVEFIAADVLLDEKPLDEKDVRTYHNRGALQFVIDQVLSDFSFGVPYRDRERTIRFVTAEIEAYCKEDHTRIHCRTHWRRRLGVAFGHRLAQFR